MLKTAYHRWGGIGYSIIVGLRLIHGQDGFYRKIAPDFETVIGRQLGKSATQKIAMQEKLTTVIFQKKGEYLLPRTNIIFIIFLKTHNTLRIYRCLSMRHSQAAVFIVTYESKAFNFVLTFPNEAIDSRVDELNYIFL